LHIKTKIVSCHAADSKPVKKEVSGTMILPHLVFPALHGTYIRGGEGGKKTMLFKLPKREFEEEREKMLKNTWTQGGEALRPYQAAWH
jgi:hypothetical protein